MIHSFYSVGRYVGLLLRQPGVPEVVNWSFSSQRPTPFENAGNRLEQHRARIAEAGREFAATGSSARFRGLRAPVGRRLLRIWKLRDHFHEVADPASARERGAEDRSAEYRTANSFLDRRFPR